MSFSVVVCEFEGAPVHVHLVVPAVASSGDYVSRPLYSQKEVIAEIWRLVEKEGLLPLSAKGEAIVQCKRWSIPPESGQKYPREYWRLFFGYKRGRPLGLAGEPIQCQFVKWLGEGGAEYAVFTDPVREALPSPP